MSEGDVLLAQRMEAMATPITRMTQVLATKQLPTPSFDGQGDARQFVDRFRTVVRLNGWPEEEAHFRLHTTLAGAAAKGLEDCHHCTDIYDRLITRFQLNEERVSQLLKQLKWAAGQDIYEFADHVQDLVRTACPEF